MSLSDVFRATGPDPKPSKPRRKRKPPFSIRLNEAERARLAELAKGRSLSAFVKDCVFGDAMPTAKRRSGTSAQNRQAFAQALGLLGKSRLSSNLNQLARLANAGSLPLTPEVEAELLAALRDVRAIRRLLMEALGLKPEDAAR